ncbi:MAG: hypothetical protein HGB11_12605 [Chlorobiales bacterium]|nr:hypothetical protein [Chlorobiales bacterium]
MAIVAGVFEVLHFFKFDRLSLTEDYLNLFGILIFCWVIFSAYYKRYNASFCAPFRQTVSSLFWTTVGTMFTVTLMLGLFEITIVSRIFVLAVTITPFLVELLFHYVYQLFNRQGVVQYEAETEIDLNQKLSQKYSWILVGAAWIIIIFFGLIYLKTGEIRLYQGTEIVLLTIFASWGISTVMTRKYAPKPTSNIYYQIAPFVKSGALMIVFVGVAFFFLRLEGLSRLLLFGTAALHAMLETLNFALFFIAKRDRDHDVAFVSQLSVNKAPEQKPLLIPEEGLITNGHSEDMMSVSEVLARISIPSKDDLLNFLSTHVHILRAKKEQISILLTSTTENIQLLPDSSLKLLVNLHKLNDMRWLNQYLLACYDKVKPGGLLIGQFEPLDNIRERFKKKMPRYMFVILYPLHFLFFRVLPKLPRVNHVYFVLTNGRNRVLSKAEVFGRLSFCGFKIIAEEEIGGKLYFIAKKVKTVSAVQKPTYGPIITLKRIGFNGQIIMIHKFRTMYPYSEFLQEYIYEHNKLDASGKFKDDFRLTSWGKLMRKLWMDELPQLYDWLQGDLKLFGVRALSQHYFSLYPEELQKLRVQHKPGLVPPYYADMPKNFEEILDSERRYLVQKTKSPFVTDVKYFIKASYNIVVKKARSK